MDNVRNSPPSTSLQRSASLRETTQVVAPQPHTPEGVSVTLASMSVISRRLSRDISKLRNNSATFEELKEACRAIEPALQRANTRVAIIMGAFAELARLQEGAAPPLRVAAQKLYMQGLACQQDTNINSIQDAHNFLNRVQPDASQHVAPPLAEHVFTGSMIEQITDRFTASDSLYKEVLASEDLPAEMRECIEQAHTIFKKDVRQAETNAKNEVKNNEAAVARTKERLKNLTEYYASMPESGDAAVRAAQEMHDRARECLTEARHNLEHLTQNAVAGILVNETIASNEAKASGGHTMASVMFGAALPQMVLSACHFGGAKAFTDASFKQRGFSLPERAGISGVVLGTTHKILSDVARPSLEYAAEKLGGRRLTPVQPDSVYPSAAKAVTVGGRVYQRTDEKLQALNKVIDEKKATFKAAQADNKIGTMKGDVKAFTAFGLAHGFIRGMPAALAESVNTAVTMTNPAFRTISSMVGGGAMAGWHAYGQLSQKVDNRHTHVPAESNPNWTKTWDDTKAGLTKAFDIRQPEVRAEYISRISGAAEGAACSMLLSGANASIDTSTAKGRIGFVASTSLESTSMLQPFYANNMAGTEAKAGNYKNKNSARLTNAFENIMNPDRPTVAHGTKAGTIPRMVENAFHIARGVTQLPSQTVTVALEPIAGAWVEGVGERIANIAVDMANAGAELNEIVVDEGARSHER